MKPYLLSVLILCLAFACNDKTVPPKPKSKNLRFQTLAKGYYSGIVKQSNILIYDNKSMLKAWNKLYKNQDEQPKPPKLDYEKEMAVLVAMGNRKSGGYSIEVIEIEAIRELDRIAVTVRQGKPGGVVTTALTQPFHLVKLAKQEGQFFFKQSGE